MRRILSRVPLTRRGWFVVAVLVILGAAVVITGSGTVAVIALAGIVVVLLLAIGPPVNARDLNTRRLPGPTYVPPRDDRPPDL